MDDVVLTNLRPHEPDVVFRPEPGDAPDVRLRPGVRYPPLDLIMGPVASRWTADELDRLAGWWDAAADGAPADGTPPLWLARPPVGFAVVQTRPGEVAVDVCWPEHPDTLMPVLNGEEADPQGGDDRFVYVTVDLDPDALRDAARALRTLADRAV